MRVALSLQRRSFSYRILVYTKEENMEEKYHQRLLEHTGKRIRFYRKLCNMSQDQLAAAIYKSESTLSKYERGAISPDVVTLYDIAHALNIDAYQLLDYEAPTQAA